MLWDFYKKGEYYKNFHLRLSHAKINDKILSDIMKALFWGHCIVSPFLFTFSEARIFPKILVLSVLEIQESFEKSEKTNK